MGNAMSESMSEVSGEKATSPPAKSESGGAAVPPPAEAPPTPGAKPVKLPAKQRAKRAGPFKRRRKAARTFLRVQMRHGVTRVLRKATQTLRLTGFARNRRRGEKWEEPMVWDIENWSSLQMGFKEKLSGPKFDRAGQRWAIELYPNGFREDVKNQVGAYLRYEGGAKCVELRFRISVMNQLGGPDVAWRSSFMFLGKRAKPADKIYTNWGTAQLLPRAWLRPNRKDEANRGLVVDDTVRLRVDVMFLGVREMELNPLKNMASLDAFKGVSRSLIASGMARRASDNKKLKGYNPMQQDKIRDEDTAANDQENDATLGRTVSYKFQVAHEDPDKNNQEHFVDFDFSS